MHYDNPPRTVPTVLPTSLLILRSLDSIFFILPRLNLIPIYGVESIVSDFGDVACAFKVEILVNLDTYGLGSL